MVKINSINLTIGDKQIELTIDEAEKLYIELQKIFNKDASVDFQIAKKWPPYNPYPNFPWDFPSKDSPPTVTWCYLGNDSK